MMMTNGFGASIGTLAAGAVIDACDVFNTPANWPKAWFIFAGYALVVAILFAIFFKYEHHPEAEAAK
jgi:phosphotransferase system  glucose/maltose/N-acetylglucosamine-specific IIC component